MRYFIFFLLFTFTTRICLGSDISFYIQKEEEDLSHKITFLLKNYDANGFSSIRIVPRQKTVNLPLTNLTFEHIEWKDQLRPRIEKITISLFTSESELPASFYEALEQLTSFYDIKPQVIFVKIEKKNNSDKSFDPIQEIEKIIQYYKGRILEISFVVSGIILSLVILSFMVKYFQYRSIAKNFESQFGNLARSFEKVGDAFDSKETPQTQMRKSNLTELEQVKKDFGQRDLKFYIAIMSDCYWCEEDEYAHYIWSQMSFESRNQFLATSEKWNDYVQFITGLNKANLNLESDINYINPVDFSHIDNSEMARIVLKSPKVFNFLSHLRIKHLQISPADKLMLLQESKKKQLQSKIDFSNHPHSIPRSISVVRRLEISSVEEESAYLSSGPISLDVKEMIPSLAWSLEIEEEALKGILAKFNAKDLALAWIGPEHVLKRIAEHIPEKKYNLILSYVAKITPSRESEVFKTIHAETIKELKSQDKNKSEARVLNVV